MHARIAETQHQIIVMMFTGYSHLYCLSAGQFLAERCSSIAKFGFCHLCRLLLCRWSETRVYCDKTTEAYKLTRSLR